MHIVRVQGAGGPVYGAIEGDVVHALEGDVFDNPTLGDEIGPLADCQLLAPVTPSKIVAIGLNYRDHVLEDAGRDIPTSPVIFLKPPSAIIGPDDSIVLPRSSKKVDAEAEVAIVIGKRCRNVSRDDYASVILGYTASNDVSARDFQQADGQWVRAKGFDTFAPLGPAIVTDLDPASISVASRVNGNDFQSSNTEHLIFDIPFLIEFVTGVMTLEPGDVIMTGTPAGPPELHDGDVCEIEIGGVGVLRNPVELEPA